MSYLVLARKWRPARFEDLVGQDAIARTLRNAITLNRMSHAILFAGSRGVGKTTTARILAKALNCEKGPTTDPCGECSNCREITAGTSVDVLEVDGASNTKVDEIRELLENIQYRPSKSRHKIYIIDEVHMLSTHSFNALLKTLEEPPPGVMFVFATTEPHKIPDTILSRCQRFDFKQIGVEPIAAHLKKIVKAEGIRIGEAGLLTVARQAYGSLRDALSLLDQLVAYAGEEIPDGEVASILGLTDRQLITRTVKSLVEHDAKEALDVLREVFEKGFDPKSYLTDVWERVRDLLVLKAGAGERLVPAAGEETARLREWAGQTDEAEMERWFDLLQRAIGDIGRSEFPRYLMEVTFLKATREEPRVPLAALVDRLEALESRLAGGARVDEKPQARDLFRAPPAVAEPPPPAAPAPKADSPQWDQLVSVVKRKRPPLAAILLQATPEFSDGKLVLSYDEGSFYLGRAKDQDFQSFIADLASGLFGGAYTVEIRTARRPSVPKGELGRGQDRSHEKEALENPVVQRAVSLFNAKVEEIKPVK